MLRFVLLMFWLILAWFFEVCRGVIFILLIVFDVYPLWVCVFLKGKKYRYFLPIFFFIFLR